MTDGANGDPPQRPAKPRGYADLKALAAERGFRVQDLIVLSPAKDPYFSELPSRDIAAVWFAALWQQYGGPGTHLRQFHYRLISAERPVLMPDDRTAYANTQADWDFLNKASVSARYQELVDVSDFVDRRSSAPRKYSDEFVVPTPPSVTIPDWKLDFIEASAPEIEIDSVSFKVPDLYLPQFRASQSYVVEVWIEKSTMNGILRPLAERVGFNLLAGTGQISEVQCRAALDRAEAARRPMRILYISDFDPAGESMPVAVARKIEYWNSQRDDPLDIQLKPIALTHAQCVHYRLPNAPVVDKSVGYMTMARRMADRYGQGVTELDALEALHPGELAQIVTHEVHRFIDPTLQARVSKAHRDRWLEVYRIQQAVIGNHDDEIEGLNGAYEAVRERYVGEFQQVADRMDTELEPLNATAEQLHGTIVAELEEAIPDTSEWEVPEPRPAEEFDYALYDSSRDYLDQIHAYKKHQAKTQPGEHRKRGKKATKTTAA